MIKIQSNLFSSNLIQSINIQIQNINARIPTITKTAINIQNHIGISEQGTTSPLRVHSAETNAGNTNNTSNDKITNFFILLLIRMYSFKNLSFSRVEVSAVSQFR